MEPLRSWEIYCEHTGGSSEQTENGAFELLRGMKTSLLLRPVQSYDESQHSKIFYPVVIH